MSNLPRLASLWLGLAISVAPLTRPVLRAADGPGGGGWEESSREDHLVIYTRERPGTSIRETRAVGTIYSPNWAVKNVLDDTDHYSSFMPYIVESKVLARDPARHTITTYCRMTPPLISARDYSLLVHDEPRRNADGTITYRTRWEPAGDKAPPEKSGVVRVKINEGSWLLESIDNGAHTKGTYTLYTDGGGGIPAFIYNQISTRRLKELFEVLEKQAQASKYRAGRPAEPPQ